MKKKLIKNIISSSVLSAIMSVLLLISAKSWKIVSLLIFCFTARLYYLGIFRQRKGEAVSMPVLRILVSTAVQAYFIFKLEPYIIRSKITDSGVKMVCWVLLCFILPLLLNLFTAVSAIISLKSKKH